MKNVSSFPKGWGYEGPDESVGIFGETFYHDECPGEYADAEHEEKWTGQVKDGHEIVIHTLVCPTCGKRAKFITREYVGFPEEAYQ